MSGIETGLRVDTSWDPARNFHLILSPGRKVKPQHFGRQTALDQALMTPEKARWRAARGRRPQSAKRPPLAKREIPPPPPPRRRPHSTKARPVTRAQRGYSRPTKASSAKAATGRVLKLDLTSSASGALAEDELEVETPSALPPRPRASDSWDALMAEDANQRVERNTEVEEEDEDIRISLPKSRYAPWVNPEEVPEQRPAKAKTTSSEVRELLQRQRNEISIRGEMIDGLTSQIRKMDEVHEVDMSEQLGTLEDQFRSQLDNADQQKQMFKSMVERLRNKCDSLTSSFKTDRVEIQHAMRTIHALQGALKTRSKEVRSLKAALVTKIATHHESDSETISALKTRVRGLITALRESRQGQSPWFSKVQADGQPAPEIHTETTEQASTNLAKPAEAPAPRTPASRVDLPSLSSPAFANPLVSPWGSAAHPVKSPRTVTAREFDDMGVEFMSKYEELERIVLRKMSSPNVPKTALTQLGSISRVLDATRIKLERMTRGYAEELMDMQSHTHLRHMDSRETCSWTVTILSLVNVLLAAYVFYEFREKYSFAGGPTL